jgi:hypothetical protein
VKCIETRSPVYLVKDDHGEILEGTLYAEGLLVVSGKELHVVFLEKLLKYSVESFVVRRQF